MSDNVNAKKKLEQIEKGRQIEKERKERISERKKTKGIDISEGEFMCREVFGFTYVSRSHNFQTSCSNWKGG